jgi:hypothetical protein
MDQRASSVDHYFITGPVEVIAYDLAHAIRAYDPTAIVKCFRDPDEAMAALDVTRPAAVLAHRDPAGFRTTRLGRALDAMGIPYAFLGALVDERDDEVIILDSPFSEATVATLLQGLLGRSQGVARV